MKGVVADAAFSKKEWLFLFYETLYALNSNVLYLVLFPPTHRNIQWLYD
jgi:hypothetical protein